MHASHRRTGAHLALAALTVLAAACQGSATPETPTPAAQGVDVRVAPATATVPTNGALTFAAAVTGTADLRVTWSVVEASGGSVDASGRYTAPSATGAYHVRATSVADPSASGDAAIAVVPPVPPVVVTISPSSPSVVAGGTVTFTATVANATDTGVIWSVAGTSCGTISQLGVYTAPAAAATCTVTAASRQAPSSAASATVTVTAAPPVTVAVTPSAAAVDACKTLQLAATVTNATNRAVTWSVQEGTAGGTVSTSGLYTAPSVAGTYHVVATSAADPSKTAISTLTVSQKVLSVAVNPANATVTSGTTAQFTATVTTTCGSFASTAALAGP